MPQHLRFRDVEYLLAVAEHRSFAKAAEALCVSQPTLSNQIKRIEAAFEDRMFDRAGRGVRLTPEGDRLMPHLRAVMRAVQDLEEAVRGEEDLAARRLKVGAIPTLAPYLGPPLLTRLRAAAPQGSVALSEGLTEELEAAVADGALDCALTATAPRDPALRAFALGDERLVYVSAAPLAEDPMAALEAAPRPILLLREGHCFRELVHAAVAAVNERLLAALNYEIAPASLSTLICLVRDGAGDALAPAPFVAALPGLFDGLQVRPLADPRFRRGVRLIVRASRAKHRDMGRLAEIAGAAVSAATPERDVS